MRSNPNETVQIMPLRIECPDPKCSWKARLVHAETGEVIPFTYLKFEIPSANDMPRIEVHLSGPNITYDLAAEMATIKEEEPQCSSQKEA